MQELFEVCREPNTDPYNSEKVRYLITRQVFDSVHRQLKQIHHELHLVCYQMSSRS